MIKSWYEGLSSRQKKLLYLALIIVLILIYSFAFTVRSVLPKNLEITSLSFSGLEGCYEGAVPEFQVEITDEKTINSVMRYLKGLPLWTFGDSLTGGAEWNVTANTTDGSSYELRFLDNYAFYFDGKLYYVKTTPFFWKGTDIYSKVCQLAGIER